MALNLIPNDGLRVLLENFCRRYDTVVEKNDIDGQFTLSYGDGKQLIFCEDAYQYSIVYASIGALSLFGTDTDNVLENALLLNAAALKQCDEIICLDEENQCLQLYRRFSGRSINSSEFDEIIDRFLNRLAAVEEKLNSWNKYSSAQTQLKEEIEVISSFRLV